MIYPLCDVSAVWNHDVWIGCAIEALNKVGAAIVKASTMDDKLTQMQLATWTDSIYNIIFA